MSFAKAFWSGLLVTCCCCFSAAAVTNDPSAVDRVKRGSQSAAVADDPYQYFPAVLTSYLWNSGWEESTRGTATRVGGRVVSVLLENHFGSDWANSAMIELSYSTNEGPDTVTTSLWQSVLWLLSNRTIYKYDKDGRVGESIYQVYYQGAWVDNGRQLFTYDTEGKLIQELQQNWQAGWTNQARTVYTYVGSDLTLQVESFWMGSAWSDVGRTTYSYSGGKLVQELYETGFGGTWQPEMRTTTTYDGDLIDTETTEGYFGGSWTNSEQYIYESYDAQGRPLVVTQKLWNGSSFENLAQDVFEYDIPTDVGDVGLVILPNGVGLSQNYPNPFNPSTQIGFTLPRRSAVTVTVFDLLGREVARLFDGVLGAGDHLVEWNGQNSAGQPAASGVYFYRLQTDDGSLSRKMLLVK